MSNNKRKESETSSALPSKRAAAGGSSSYEPKNILVTGGAGFIGSNVVIHLVKKYPNYNIINLDKFDYCSSAKNLDEIKSYPNHKVIKGNILSPDLVNYLLEEEKIDTIMHFAAQTHVDNSFGNSFLFTENNIMGTHVLLEAAKVHNIRRFIHVSTDEVYGGIGHTEPHNEKTLLQPTNPYAATKAGAELLVQSYHKSFSLPTIITRGNNVYGPRQYPEKLIPKFTCLLNRGQACCVHGSGNNRRSFIYVEDVAEAFDVVLHKGVIGEIYNIGTKEEITNLRVAKDLIRLFGLQEKEKEFLKFVEDRPFNDWGYFMDVDKLEELGWSVKVSWEEGLKKTVAWYQQCNLSEWWPDYETALVPHPRRNDFVGTKI